MAQAPRFRTRDQLPAVAQVNARPIFAEPEEPAPAPGLFDDDAETQAFVAPRRVSARGASRVPAAEPVRVASARPVRPPQAIPTPQPEAKVIVRRSEPPVALESTPAVAMSTSDELPMFGEPTMLRGLAAPPPRRAPRSANSILLYVASGILALATGGVTVMLVAPRSPASSLQALAPTPVQRPVAAAAPPPPAAPPFAVTEAPLPVEPVECRALHPAEAAPRGTALLAPRGGSAGRPARAARPAVAVSPSPKPAPARPAPTARPSAAAPAKSKGTADDEFSRAAAAAKQASQAIGDAL